MVKITLFQLQNSCQKGKMFFQEKREKKSIIIDFDTYFFSHNRNIFPNLEHTIRTSINFSDIQLFSKHLFCKKTTHRTTDDQRAKEIKLWHAFCFYLSVMRNPAKELSQANEN